MPVTDSGRVLYGTLSNRVLLEAACEFKLRYGEDRVICDYENNCVTFLRDMRTKLASICVGDDDGNMHFLITPCDPPERKRIGQYDRYGSLLGYVYYGGGYFTHFDPEELPLKGKEFYRQLLPLAPIVAELEEEISRFYEDSHSVMYPVLEKSEIGLDTSPYDN
jgi:hypothetical protein